MAKKTKFFRVAVEGATTDGREISRDWLKQMAATYDPKTYGARVFAEHIRGIVPDGPFRALGDVVALKTEEVADGALKGKLALYAQIDPSDAMVKLINSGQKIYSSMEIDHEFAGTKQAYLVSLGVTDSPASLGTEVLAFSAQHPDASPFKARKRRPENLFSAAIESDIALEDEDSDADPAAGFFTKLNSLLDKFAGNVKTKVVSDPAPAVVPDQDDAKLRGELAGTLKEFSTATAGAIDALRTEMTVSGKRMDDAIAEFRKQLDTTPANANRRPPATGGTGTVMTDC